MRRVLTALCLFALLAPAATAHEGSQVPPLFVVQTEVTPDDPLHNFPLQFPQSLQAPGALAVVTAVNHGPADLSMFLQADGEEVTRAPLPGDGAPVMLAHVVEIAANLTVHFELFGDDDSAAVDLMFDAEPRCDAGLKWYCSKHLPFEMDAPTMVVPMPIETPGTYRTVVANNDVHDLRVSVWDPAMQTEIASTQQANSQGEIILDWTVDAAGDYHLVLTSLAVHDQVFFDALSSQGNGAAYETLRVTVLSEGPFNTGIPGPGAPLGALAVLALALVVRRVTG